MPIWAKHPVILLVFWVFSSKMPFWTYNCLDSDSMQY